ncbi:MAG: MBL fold metallo-hydrolase [Clostridia bacterium]|jgi:phosphoribosyl 1,2-cyclic phosphodiesterase|nr:MBL fold metallo-hydrolase [Clostridia bacterium]MDD4572195.1 MBL fold metallo-hydrolase [Clostridia bacterium]
MEFTAIASGSRGNCIFIKGGQTKLLVDSGISALRVARALAAFGEDVRSIQGILVTHEHHDHISGIRMLVKKYGLPVYAAPMLWQNLPFTEAMPSALRRSYSSNMQIGEITVSFCRTSHDALLPVGMVFSHGGKRLGVVTDTGMVTPSMLKCFQNLDGLILEANHNETMLAKGPYPAYLKRRVAGREGHLSNKQAAYFLAEIMAGKPFPVMLAHLSEVNNTPSTARREILACLDLAGITDDFELHVGSPCMPHPLIAI